MLGISLVCLSHLRCDFVFQRPQHLMTRFAKAMRVYFVEEPVYEDISSAFLSNAKPEPNLTVLVPHLPRGAPRPEAAQRQLLSHFLLGAGVTAPILWFYTPAALAFAAELPSSLVVYDCMDELSAFQGAAPELKAQETELLARADLVFTGGVSLYEAKRRRHARVHAFPSAVDAEHFKLARKGQPEPADQISIPHPRLGFFGVLDERLDRDLLREAADLRPDWHFVLIGPVVKIDPALLPQAPNIHYLGRKQYSELPAYVSGWDVAMIPFACNEATRFISPTKTPEYLAAAKPVISTPIADVVRGWGHLEAVRSAATPQEFVEQALAALALRPLDRSWLDPVDADLKSISWDQTWSRMSKLMEASLTERRGWMSFDRPITSKPETGDMHV